MDRDREQQPFRAGEKKALKKKIHRALLDARNARHSGDEDQAQEIVRRMMAEAAPAAYQASRESSFNWVVEALKPLDEFMLPDDDTDGC